MKKKLIYYVISYVIAAVMLAFGITLMVQALTPKADVKISTSYTVMKTENEREEREMIIMDITVNSRGKYDIKNCYVKLWRLFETGGRGYEETIYLEGTLSITIAQQITDAKKDNVYVGTVEKMEVNNEFDIALSIVLMILGCAIVSTDIVMQVLQSKRKKKAQTVTADAIAREEKQQ